MQPWGATPARQPGTGGVWQPQWRGDVPTHGAGLHGTRPRRPAPSRGKEASKGALDSGLYADGWPGGIMAWLLGDRGTSSA